MRVSSFKLFISALILSISGIVALANTSNTTSSVLRFEIPFEFQIGNEEFPAGEYQIQYDIQKSYVTIRGEGKTGLILASTSTRSNSGKSFDQNGITFHRYGKTTFLRGVSSPSNDFSVQESKAEKRVRKGSSKSMVAEMVLETEK